MLQIVDSGIGMTEKQLAELRQSLTFPNHSYEHIGIHNIYKRLILTYGEDVHFNIKSKYQRGTIVVISFPVSMFPEQ